MAIEFTPNTISSGYNLAKLNDNFVKLTAAFNDALSRSGKGPNQMNADLDMNGYNLLNIDGIGAESIVINGMTAEQFLNSIVGNIITAANLAASQAEASATASANSATASQGYASASAASAATANTLVQQATAGFIGFPSNAAYDFGSVTETVTYFNQDWGTIP